MTPCPQCGSPADLGLVDVYCTNRACVYADEKAIAAAQSSEDTFDAIRASLHHWSSLYLIKILPG